MELETIKKRLKLIQNHSLSFTKYHEVKVIPLETIPKFYYYKRWVWMNFPWACSSIGNNYSEVIYKCYSSATNYISVEDEKNLRRDALRIVLESKIKKDKLFRDKSLKSQSEDPNNQSINNQDSLLQKKVFKNILKAIESEDQTKKSPYQNEDILLNEKKAVKKKTLNELSDFLRGKRKEDEKLEIDKAIILNDITADTVDTTYLYNSKSESHRKMKGLALKNLDSPRQQGAKDVPTIPKIKFSKEIRSMSPIESKKLAAAEEAARSQRNEVKYFITDEFFNLKRQNSADSASSNKKGNLFPYLASIEQGEKKFTSKILSKSKMIKKKYDHFEIDGENFKRDKQETAISILPKLKENIQEHSFKEIALVKRQNELLTKEYNQLIYTNKSLARELKELKIMEFCENTFKGDISTINDLNSKIESLSKEISESEENYYNSKKQRKRLEKIIKICENNSGQNKEWIRSLNFLLQNYEKMIKWEQEKIQKDKDETKFIYKTLRKYLEVCGKQVNNHIILIEEIKRNLKDKSKFDKMFRNVDELIEGEAVLALEKLREEYQNYTKEKSNKIKDSLLSIDNSQEEEMKDIQEIKHLLSLRADDFQNPESNEKVKLLLTQIQKKKELEKAVFEGLENLNHLDKRYKIQEQIHQAIKTTQDEESKNKVETSFKRNLESLSRLDIQQKIEECQKKILIKTNAIKSFEDIILSSNLLIKTLHEKADKKIAFELKGMKLEDLNFEKLSFDLLKKLEFIKNNLSEEEYSMFLLGNYDFKKVFLNRVPFEKKPIDNDEEIDEEI